VFVDARLEVFEVSDTKGMYLKAQLREIGNFTDVNDQYKVTEDSEIRIETDKTLPFFWERFPILRGLTLGRLPVSFKR
jgi:adenylylsulfate kinase-like enzyme